MVVSKKLVLLKRITYIQAKFAVQYKVNKPSVILVFKNTKRGFFKRKQRAMLKLKSNNRGRSRAKSWKGGM